MPQRIKPSAKLVLLVLADASNTEGVSWLSVTTVAQRACLSVRQVRAWLEYLEGLGLIDRTPRNGPKGRQTSNVVTLNMATRAPLIPFRTPPGKGGQPVDNFSLGRRLSVDSENTGRREAAALDPTDPKDQGVQSRSNPVDNFYAERPSRAADYSSGPQYDPLWRPGKINRETGREALAAWRKRQREGE